MEQSERYKQSLFKSIEREWLALLSVVERLTPEQMITLDKGGWAPKDNLVHLTQWLKILVSYHIDGKSDVEELGLPQEMADNFELQQVNTLMFEHNKNRPAAEILDELKSKYAEVMVRLAAMPLETLMQPRFADDEQKRPLVFWILGNTSEHFAEHRAVIERQLR